MRTAFLPLSAAASFEGAFISGEDSGAAPGAAPLSSLLELLDVARRQYSSSEVEWQSVDMLYRGDWDGLMEGPTWGAWWTQNSFGPTMGALPFMGAVTWAATQHSQAWWFDAIGDGVASGRTGEGPAPDGCLCDASTPCAPAAAGAGAGAGTGTGTGARANTCAWYKQGDGVVPKHDWTVEESLSAVVMQAEMLLVGRNASGARHFLPLFRRTSDWLESRRDPATANTTHLTGPATNLLAPSWGGGPQRGAEPEPTMAYLAGCSITYCAALNRVIEVARMVGDEAAAAALEPRRDLTMAGLGLFLQRNDTTNSSSSSSSSSGGGGGGGSGGAAATPKKKKANHQQQQTNNHYFVRSVDPAATGGARHGVLGARRFGYFEASPNHDAVAWRVVNDTLAQEIMGTIDALGARLRPNTFILPNTDAGGGVGYDDMLCADGGTYCDGETRGGIFAYGRWVNGGAWTTQEARAILAYLRTGRAAAAAASMRTMLTRFGRGWRMDNPLPNFGLDTWAHAPVMLTIDAFGCGAALLRGMYVRRSSTRD